MNWIYSIAPMILGYFLLRFGMATKGKLSDIIQFIGGTVCFASTVFAWFLLGWQSWLGFIAIFFFLITPLVEVVISKIENKADEPHSQSSPERTS